MKKRALSVLLVVLMLFAVVAPAMAVSTEVQCSDIVEIAVEGTRGTEVTAYVPAEFYSFISEEELREIAIYHNLQDGEAIVIHSVGYVQDFDENYIIGPRTVVPIVLTNTTVTPTGNERRVADHFVTSVARGQSIRLSSTWTRSLSTRITAGTPLQVGGALSATISRSYSTAVWFNGPPEGGNANSREFRVRFYERNMTWRQEQVFGGVVIATRTGSGTMPTRFVSFSIDRFVS